MSEQSDVILTPNSFNDDYLKWVLDRHLWGYPKLADACPVSILAKEDRMKSAQLLPTVHSEAASDASGGRPGGGDIAQDPNLSHSPSREDRAFTNEDVNPDIHGVYTNETENHPENDSEQSVTNAKF